jgi:hypothetical protein
LVESPKENQTKAAGEEFLVPGKIMRFPTSISMR